MIFSNFFSYNNNNHILIHSSHQYEYLQIGGSACKINECNFFFLLLFLFLSCELQSVYTHNLYSCFLFFFLLLFWQLLSKISKVILKSIQLLTTPGLYIINLAIIINVANGIVFTGGIENRRKTME